MDFCLTQGNMELCKNVIFVILIEPCFFDHSLTMKKVFLVICVLVMFSKMVYVNATGTCLATKEKGYLQTIRNTIQQITSQIAGLENSLKGKYSK
jgi:hypothetical protein